MVKLSPAQGSKIVMAEHGETLAIFATSYGDVETGSEAIEGKLVKNSKMP